jgi:site-specific recombinase XerD
MRRQLRLAADLSSWMQQSGVAPPELVGDRLDQFLRFREAGGSTILLSRRALRPLLDHLGQAGVVFSDVPWHDCHHHGALLDAYERYLVSERGLRPATVACYLRASTRFLDMTDPAPSALWTLSGRTVSAFVLHDVASRRVAAAKQAVNALRSCCRYLFIAGLTERDLSGAVPGVAGWSSPSVPRGIDHVIVDRLLSSFDATTVTGRRDYAMVQLACRLGLRSSEVTSLCLDDIDWFHGELLIRGKGQTIERLPLPADVGAAVARYLSGGRPRCAARNVFLTARAPTRPLGHGALTAVLHRGCDRAGIERFGPHRLRHTAATAMLRQGASLLEVAEVLRHRSTQSTARYAKVDYQTLRPLARAWPVVAP